MKQKNELTLYLAFAFGLAWICQVGGCIALGQGHQAVYQIALMVTMLCPLAAVLVVTRLFGHRPSGVKWRPQFRGKLRFWLAAWFGPAVFAVLGAALYFLIFPSRFDPSGSYLKAMMGEAVAEQLAQQGITPTVYALICLVQALTYAPLVNMLFAVGEEAGWRGFMLPMLKERFGLWKGRIIGGVIWGIWHWPVMLLSGYEYGTDYLGAPVLGLAVFCLVCFAWSTLLDILYEKTNCIWVPAIGHGAINASAGVASAFIRTEDLYYSVLGPMPVGLIAILPALVLAVWLTWKEANTKQEA
ncbi:MAG: lysostaphin resistance A-like protein [Faecalibacterium sp.]